SSRPAEEAQASDAAVRKDIEPHVAHVANRAQLLFERVPRVRLQRRLRQQLAPRRPLQRRAEIERVVASESKRRVGTRVQAAGTGRVAHEMTRVDLDAANRAFGTEPND